MRCHRAINTFKGSYRGDPLRPYRMPPEGTPYIAPVAAPMPTLMLLSPGQSSQTSVQVDVRGSNFVQTSQVIVDGKVMPSTFVSDGRISATFTTVTPGTFDVVVRNSDNVSNVKQFTFN